MIFSRLVTPRLRARGVDPENEAARTRIGLTVAWISVAGNLAVGLLKGGSRC